METWCNGIPRHDNVVVTMPNGYKVQRIQIIGTACFDYSVWVPFNFSLAEPHYSTITTFDGVWHGRYGTNPLPAELDALPAYTVARVDAVQAWHNKLYNEAYEYIYATFPALRDLPHRCDMGQISYTGNTPA